jgi:hypothetical protein
MPLLEFLLILLTALVMFTGAVIGALLPIPGAWVVWFAALGYGLLRSALGYPWFDGRVGGIAMIFLTILALVDLGLEFVITHSVLHKRGVSGRAIAASIGLGFLGLAFPPIGPLVGALLGLFAVEYFKHNKDWRTASRAVWNYAQGCGWAALAEFGLSLMMMSVWVVWVVLALIR